MITNAAIKLIGALFYGVGGLVAEVGQVQKRTESSGTKTWGRRDVKTIM